MTFVIVMGFHQIIVVMNDVKRHTYIHIQVGLHRCSKQGKIGPDVDPFYRNSNNNNKTLNNHIFIQTYFHVMKSTDLESYILLLSKIIKYVLVFVRKIT